MRNCRGVDLRVMPERVAELLVTLDADVVALQELDVGRSRTHRLDQPAWLAARLGMRHVFCETIYGYGHALLTRCSIERSERLALPVLSRESEPRAALELELDVGGRSVRVLSTHLGLSAADRTTQARILAERARPDRPTIVIGDLNAGPGQLGYVELVPRLSDPLADRPPRERRTWPALYPLRALDHVLLSRELAPVSAAVLDSRAARFASDHRPVVADAVLIDPSPGTGVAPTTEEGAR